jgi:hypothetical protein
MIVDVLLVQGRDSCCCSLGRGDYRCGHLDCLLRCCLCCSNAGLTCIGIGCCCCSNICSLVSKEVDIS